MVIPTIDTNFYDNDKYWYDIGAKYTMRVYDILQNAQIGNNRKSNIDLLENYDSSLFGLDSYPIFDEAFRKPINDMIISHFIEYEIGYETDFLFRTHMRSDMYRIMNDLNVKFKARLQMYNTTNLFETDNGTSTREVSDEHKFLDTPQGQTDLIDDNYLTNVSKNSSSESSTHSGTTGTAAQNASAYVLTAWDFETEICDGLKHNFMGLFA